MTDLAPLLVVQDHDTTIDQLVHRLATVPARAAVTEKEGALADAAASLVPVQARRDELARSQKRLEDEVAMLEAKVAEEDARLYSGAVTAARDLQDLQHEIDALRRRQGELETEILEIMDLTEPIEVQLAEIDGLQMALRSEIERLRGELAEAEAAIGSELEAVRAERAVAAEAIPADLLTTYERLRTELGGTAVARLTGTTCGACHLGLPAVEIDRLKREATVGAPTCTECGALLVL